MTKEEIMNKLKKEGGFYITDPEFKPDYNENGKNTIEYLKNKGFNIIDYKKTNFHGLIKIEENHLRINCNTKGYIYIVGNYTIWGKAY